MAWKHLKVFAGWKKNEPVQVGRDGDGDIGILDAHGYSIYIGRDDAKRMAEHILHIVELEDQP